MKEEAAETSQRSATDDYPEVSRPPLYTQWNPDTGMTEVRRGYRSPIPEGKYIARTWTHAPPEPHVIRYEGIKHGYRDLVTRVYNPKTWYFEVKRSPPPSPTVSPVPGLHGASSDIKPLSHSKSRTAIKPSTSKISTLPGSTTLVGTSKTSHITGSTYHKGDPKAYKITKGSIG